MNPNSDNEKTKALRTRVFLVIANISKLPPLSPNATKIVKMHLITSISTYTVPWVRCEEIVRVQKSLLRLHDQSLQHDQPLQHARPRSSRNLRRPITLSCHLVCI